LQWLQLLDTATPSGLRLPPENCSTASVTVTSFPPGCSGRMSYRIQDDSLSMAAAAARPVSSRVTCAMRPSPAAHVPEVLRAEARYGRG